MLPGPIKLLGSQWASWDLAFMIAVLLGYPVLVRVLRDGRRRVSLLPLRYMLLCYLCALAAQLFAYAFDHGTTLVPPIGTSTANYYLNPLSGPKTLFGAILMLPFAARVAFFGTTFGNRRAAFDIATPPLMTVLGVSRIGCFLQGCCYGWESNRWGLSFPPGSVVHAEQYSAAAISGSDPSLPVLPLQLACAATCFILAGWSYCGLRNGNKDVFLTTVGAYSAVRFILEFFRADPARNYFGPLSTSQWVAAVVLLVLGVRHHFTHLKPSHS